PSVSAEQANFALESAQEAFPKWAGLSINEREEYILKYAEVIESHREEIIDLLMLETGKLYGNAVYDYEMIPNCLKFFAAEAKSLHGEIIPDYDQAHINMIIRKPIGVVVGYLAWNFPLLNVGYKMGPSLASGCTCVLKPSSQTPLATMYVASLAEEAGMPKGVVNVVVGSGAKVSKVLNESTIPSMLTLIGSSATGMKIIEQSATSIKRYSLELGGNAPVMVMKDADVRLAAECTADLKVGNAGQVCVCANRVFVHEDIYEEYIDITKEFMSKVSLGSGKDDSDGNIYLAPLVSDRAVAQMQDFVNDAVAKGAKVECGGKIADREGYFFEPTVLSGVTSDMKVYKEEIFGPILPIIKMTDSDCPKDLANDTEYGLAAYIYTKDLKTAMTLSQEIDSGSVCVNEPFYNFNLPHGGCKQSGVGKDCSVFSLEEYYNIQRISIKL
ncbi:MAG: aldehyde dehydrogenase family protein, partial [Clostridia bacterium]